MKSDICVFLFFIFFMNVRWGIVLRFICGGFWFIFLLYYWLFFYCIKFFYILGNLVYDMICNFLFFIMCSMLLFYFMFFQFSFLKKLKYIFIQFKELDNFVSFFFWRRFFRINYFKFLQLMLLEFSLKFLNNVFFDFFQFQELFVLLWKMRFSFFTLLF